MTQETYNGWANRETWALHLWIKDEQLRYRQARFYASRGDEREGEETLREYVVDDLWPRLPYTPDGLQMMREVGSLWRVDWGAVTRALRAG